MGQYVPLVCPGSVGQAYFSFLFYLDRDATVADVELYCDHVTSTSRISGVKDMVSVIVCLTVTLLG